MGARLVDEWIAANPRSRSLHEAACRILPSGVTHDVRRPDPFPLTITRAEGARKWDADGHELVCYVMGHGSLLFGHSHPPVVEAVRRQAGVFLHAGASHDLERDWAEQVLALVPAAEQVRFTSSGTEATLLALQLARATTGRSRIVKLEGHFHGWHDYAAFGVDPPYKQPTRDARDPGRRRRLGHGCRARSRDCRARTRRRRCRGRAARAGWRRLGHGGVAERLCLRGARTDERGRRFARFRRGRDRVPLVARRRAGAARRRARPDGVREDPLGRAPRGAVAGRAEAMDALVFGSAVKVSHQGCHNAHPLSAAAGTETLRLAADGVAQDQTAERAAVLRNELNSVLFHHGAPGLVHGHSSTFCVLLGHDGPLDEIAAETVKLGVTGKLATALHCGMLLHGVQLFHGAGFISTAHGDTELDRTILAFDGVVPRLQQEGLL